MTMKKAVLTGCSLGLIMPSVSLALLSFGISGELTAGRLNLTLMLWPSIVMLVTGWRSTVPGIMITISAIAINCLIYSSIAIALRACAQAAKRPREGSAPPPLNARTPTSKRVVLASATTAMTVSGILLSLMWFRASVPTALRSVALRRALWPSSLMLVRGWCCTVPGIMITASAIAINCLTYIGIALLARACIRVLARYGR